MKLRIALTGASGSGKTTLANFLSEKFALPINPIGSRSVAKAMGFESPYDVDKAGRRAEFQHRLATEKIEWERQHEEFVTDRTTLDNLTYSIMHDISAVDASFVAKITQGMQRYSHVAHCLMAVFLQSIGRFSASSRSNLSSHLRHDSYWSH